MIIKKKGAKSKPKPSFTSSFTGTETRSPPKSYTLELISRGLRLWTHCRREGMRLAESQSRTGEWASVACWFARDGPETEYEVRISVLIYSVHCRLLE